MSAIAALYNVPSNENETNNWAFAHACHHRDINRRIYLATGVALEEFILDPLDPNDIGVWLRQHQTMHQDFEGVLGLEGFDLLDVDWKDQQELAGWIILNGTTHLQAANILGIG